MNLIVEFLEISFRSLVHRIDTNSHKLIHGVGGQVIRSEGSTILTYSPFIFRIKRAPEQVPDTFLLNNLKDVGGHRYTATKALVRIDDVVTAMGPRVPASSQAQKSFSLAIYVLHEPGRTVDPKMHRRAGRIGTALVKYYQRATGGRLQVVASDTGG